MWLPGTGVERGGFNRKKRKGYKEEGTHHEGTKDTKGSDIYTLKLRKLRAFVVKYFFSSGQFWLRLCRATAFVVNFLALPAG